MKLSPSAERLTPHASVPSSWPTGRAKNTGDLPTRRSAIGGHGSTRSPTTSASCALRNSTGTRKSDQSSGSGATATPSTQALPSWHGVLSRVLSYAVDPLGKLGSNPSEGIKRLHSADRSEIIWAESDIATLKASCSPEIAHAVDLAVHTGLRLGDLTKLCWSHVGDDRIVIPTRKSRGRQKAIIPLYSALQAVLADIPKHSTTILTNRRGRPWRDLASAFVDAKAKAGIEGLHFHDLRGTAATYFYTAGLAERDIAEILGWEEESVHKIIRRYVGRNAAIIALLDKAGR